VYQLINTSLEGCYEILPTVFTDHRGSNIKPFHIDTFKKLGIEYSFGEDFVAKSVKGVIRGFHFQNPPHAQAKLVYCVNGSIMDIALDIRKGSPTYGKYQAFNLSGSKNNMLFIPEGFAHGYLTLEDNTIALYKMSSVYNPESEGGIRWDSIGVDWGIADPIISVKDRNYAPFYEFESKFVYK